MVMTRVPEPELMDGAAQARAYAQADFSEPNRLFCALLERQPLPSDARGRDLGWGPADIPLQLLRAWPQWKLCAVDGSQAMLDHAAARVAAAGIGERVELVQGRLGRLALPEHGFDLVISNSLLHHLHDPLQLWSEIRLRARPGARVQVMDLMRPDSDADAAALVERYAADAPDLLRADYAASLRAAFTPDEVAVQLQQVALELPVEVVSDRHLLVGGRLP